MTQGYWDGQLEEKFEAEIRVSHVRDVLWTELLLPVWIRDFIYNNCSSDRSDHIM